MPLRAVFFRRMKQFAPLRSIIQCRGVRMKQFAPLRSIIQCRG